ncbi:MAG: hypothetical protein HRT58_04880 [Crocinitomicaceae bacterium]|nr:hypothetical protein [Flavobacteriales bacterium]NQZ34973.1 hypothetical protein [Crocinitomicaceae bacterium]
MDMSNILLLLPNIPILLVAIYAGYYFSQFNKELRVFSGFLFLSILIQIPSVILYLLEMNNMPLLHIYTLLGGYILIRFYRVLLKNYLAIKVLSIVSGLFVLFAIIDSLFIEGIFTFNTIGLTVEAVIVVILALSTFNLLMQEKSQFQDKQMLKSISWINSGFFIYFSSNLLLYYFGDYLVRSTISISSFRIVWTLHSLFSITMYIFFFIALWKTPKKSISYPH